MKQQRRRGLNGVELSILSAGLAALSFMAGLYWMGTRARGGDELEQFAGVFGPSRNSENGEEWLIRDFFKDQRGGVFVDVGANHYQRFNNTYLLETELGWTGVAVEPQVKFAADYAKFRPGTTFIPLFVSDTSNEEATLHVPEDDLAASSSREFAEGGGEITPTRATTTTLDDLLDRNGITRIDLLSMDIELAEPAALAGFTIERFKPRLVAIEGHLAVRQQILDYFAKNDYVLVGKYLRADETNLWFAPLATTDR